jgi:hypothetical protein
MRLGRLVIALAAAAAAMLALAALAGAKPKRTIKLKSPYKTFSVPKPQDVAFDALSGDLYVLSRGDPPAIYHQKIYPREGVKCKSPAKLNLKPNANPQAMEFGTDGGLWVIDNGNKEIDHFAPGWCQDYPDPYDYLNILLYGGFLSEPQTDALVNGLAFGYRAKVLEYGGNADTGKPGSALFGKATAYKGAYQSQLQFGDTTFPNGVDLLPGIRGLNNGLLPSEFLFFDAQNTHLLKVRDSLGAPKVTGTSPGPPAAGGATPGTDLMVFPIDLDPQVDGSGTNPFVVPVPGLGQIFESTAPGKPWQPLLNAPAGRPVRADSSCNYIAWSDFANDLVTVAPIKVPAGSTCDDIFNLIALGAANGFKAHNIPDWQLEYLLKVNLGYSGKARAKMKVKIEGGPKQRTVAATGDQTALGRKIASNVMKARLRPGRVKNLKLSFTHRASLAIYRALRRGSRVTAILQIRFTSLAGETTTVRRKTRIRLRSR